MNTNKGFTLIELLVVIAILGVLASLVVSAMQSAREEARLKRYIQGLRQFQTGLELYHLDHGAYPTNLNRSPHYFYNLNLEPDRTDFGNALTDYYDINRFMDSIPNSHYNTTFYPRHPCTSSGSYGIRFWLQHPSDPVTVEPYFSHSFQYNPDIHLSVHCIE